MNGTASVLKRPFDIFKIFTSSKGKKDITEIAEISIFNTLFIGFGIGAIGLIGYQSTISKEVKSIIYIGIFLAIASFIVGFFTGTLFGMPKRKVEENGDYSLNNSLVEISDWLTKIIVGLGLVNLKQIPGYLTSMGDYVYKITDSKVQSFNLFSICIIVYFSVLGLYVGYNYMRLVLSQKYKTADDFLVTKLKSELQETENQKDEIIQATSMLDTLIYDDINEGYVKEMTKNANKKYKEGLAKNEIDPQKGRWGKSQTNHNRELRAEVQEVIKNSIYSINLEIVSLDPQNPLMEGEIVLFALHQTFGEPPFRYVKIENGRAKLSLICYGSFTVGAFVDKGQTELELDLAELPGVSKHFKNT